MNFGQCWKKLHSTSSGPPLAHILEVGLLVHACSSWSAKEGLVRGDPFWNDVSILQDGLPHPPNNSGVNIIFISLRSLGVFSKLTGFWAAHLLRCPLCLCTGLPPTKGPLVRQSPPLTTVPTNILASAGIQPNQSSSASYSFSQVKSRVQFPVNAFSEVDNF